MATKWKDSSLRGVVKLTFSRVWVSPHKLASGTEWDWPSSSSRDAANGVIPLL